MLKIVEVVLEKIVLAILDMIEILSRVFRMIKTPLVRIKKVIQTAINGNVEERIQAGRSNFFISQGMLWFFALWSWVEMGFPNFDIILKQVGFFNTYLVPVFFLYEVYFRTQRDSK